MKLWLDDQEERRAPRGWTIARTSKEAIALLSTEVVEEISIDHDLGGKDEGIKVVDWMIEHNTFPKTIHVHSWNPYRANTMCQALRVATNSRVDRWSYSLRYVEELEARDSREEEKAVVIPFPGNNIPAEKKEKPADIIDIRRK